MENYRIDNLQYCNWSKEIFQVNNEAKLDAVHVTIAYHEDFNEVKKNVETWNKHFQSCKDLIFHGKTFKDIENSYDYYVESNGEYSSFGGKYTNSTFAPGIGVSYKF